MKRHAKARREAPPCRKSGGAGFDMRNRLFGAASWAALTLALGGVAQAQDATPQDAAPSPGAASAEDEAIVVTGSRIARRDYTSASPIVTTNAEAIEAGGQINLEAALSELPQFTPGQNESSNPIGGGGRATVNLRGLGEQRNLVLLDGRRLPLSSVNGLVDLNVLPRSIVSSVEVITGGASAVYGSDAISGVVNFITPKNFNGITLDGQFGSSFEGDALRGDASVTMGTDIADDRGNALISLSYGKRDALFGADRDFFARGVNSGFLSSGRVLLPGPAPSQAAVNTVFGGYGVAAGTVSAAGPGFGFNDDGTLFAIAGGVNFRGDANQFGVVNGQLNQFTAPHNTIVQPQERYSIFGKFTYEVAPDVQFFLQGLYTNSNVRMATGYPITLPTFPTIPTTNPFVPADLSTLLATRPPGAPVVLFKRFEETGRRFYDEQFDTFQIVGGFEGTLPYRDWTWTAYFSHDESVNRETLENGVVIARVQQLLNAADGGNSICAGGYNPFSRAGSAAISQACLDYISVALHTDTELHQNIAEANLQGALLNLPAGDVRFALTADYRENKYSASPDSLLIPLPGTTNAQVFATTPVLPTTGRTSVVEIAGELLVPLVANSPFAESLNLTLGYRYSDYNLSGGVSTYKGELDWRPINSLLFRGGYERAIRAPNPGELFSNQVLVAQIGNPPGGGDPCDVRTSVRTGANASAVRSLCLGQGVSTAIVDTYTFATNAIGQTLTGNRSLDPERADTFTGGAVWRPDLQSALFSDLSLSVDYYNIKVEDAISFLSGATALNKCFNLDGSNPTYSAASPFCTGIRRDSVTGVISIIDTPYLNLGGLRTSGVDVQVDWTMDFGRAGRLAVNSVMNFLADYEVQSLPGSPFQDYTGTVVLATGATPPLPDWRAQTAFTYSLGPASLGLRWQYYPAMDDVSSVTSSTPAPGVPRYSMFDLFGRYQLTETLEIRAGVTNLLDKDPLVIGGVTGNTNPGLYDIVGRSFFIGGKLRFE